MPDQVDRAQALDERQREAALARWRRRHRAAAAAAHSCASCGEPIPEARRLAVPGCRRCAACQAGIEGGRAWQR